MFLGRTALTRIAVCANAPKCSAATWSTSIKWCAMSWTSSWAMRSTTVWLVIALPPHTHTHSHISLNLNRISIGVRYERVQHDGPKVRVITIQHPLFTPYFTDGGLKGKPLADVETGIFGAAGRHMMAHNGWVMSADPLRDFARPNEGRGNVYLKRELIAWGDSVKLR